MFRLAPTDARRPSFASGGTAWFESVAVRWCNSQAEPGSSALSSAAIRKGVLSHCCDLRQTMATTGFRRLAGMQEAMVEVVEAVAVLAEVLDDGTALLGQLKEPSRRPVVRYPYQEMLCSRQSRIACRSVARLTAACAVYRQLWVTVIGARCRSFTRFRLAQASPHRLGGGTLITRCRSWFARVSGECGRCSRASLGWRISTRWASRARQNESPSPNTARR
jgi:hypothetical protein